MRTLEVTNKTLIDGINKMYELSSKLETESKIAQKLFDEFNTLREQIGMEIDKIKIGREKTVEKWEKELGEYEIISNLRKEKGKYIAEIVDEFEEWKLSQIEKLKKEKELLADRKKEIIKASKKK